MYGHSAIRNPQSAFDMKLIIAIIQPSKLEEVKAALSQVEVVRLTIMDVQGFGRQKGQTEVYRGREITVNLLRKVQLQIAVNEDFVEPTIDAIIQGGRSGEAGQIGDGKIFVLRWTTVSASAPANAARKRFSEPSRPRPRRRSRGLAGSLLLLAPVGPRGRRSIRL